MGWNYRVMRRVVNGEVDLSIREVYYGGDGQVHAWTVEPVDPHGENLEELRDSLNRMLACLDQPVLDEEAQLAATAVVVVGNSASTGNLAPAGGRAPEVGRSLWDSPERTAAGCCLQCWDDYTAALPSDAPLTLQLHPKMFLCPTCGNKRCPKASDHRQACTASNAPGQAGSRF